jgi:leucyl aminopeptidase
MGTVSLEYLSKAIAAKLGEGKKLEITLSGFAKENFAFEGKNNQAHLVTDGAQMVAVIGAGAEKKLNDLELQKIGSRIVAFLNAMKIKEGSVFFEAKNLPNLAFGALLQSYRFNKYFENKKKDKELKVQTLNVMVADVSKAQKEFAPLEILAENIFFLRDLVSEPSNILEPESYAAICKTLKKDGLEVEVLGEAEMKKLGMGSLLGVGQGSEKESQLVILKWNGGKKGEQPLAFVGKGVTFDTGGISIKPSNNMEDMKTDMAGSAVVVSLLRNLAQRKAKVNVVGVVGLVENMPSGTAQRPGDVVKSMSGQTIEVINTDAEGRLVLADALHYTNTKFKPKFIVDLATLTGAIVVCLADVYAGLFSNDDDLAKKLESCGTATGERVWRMPLGEEYDEMINSDIADMKNVGSGRGAGSTTAAQFLKRFVGETKWAHLDIAGVAWKGKGDAMAVKGASGFGVKLLDELVKTYEKK